ncbi:hypothetical protein Tco_0948265, partial [Tanacetum coccineum]
CYDFVDRLDYDARPFPVSFTPSSLWQIDDSMGVVMSSKWGHVGGVGSVSIRPGDIKLLLVAFYSQLKIFHPLLNDNTSGEHP